MNDASHNLLREMNARHQLHPMSHPGLAEKLPPHIIAAGEGCFVTDIDGNRFLDGVGGLWNVNVGHGRPEVKAAIVEQLDRIAYYSCFGASANAPSIALSARVMEMTAPEGMARVLFSSGGSDAVETALKLARQYWKLVGEPSRTKFISLRQAYHGTHFGGTSVNGNPVYRGAYEPLLPGCIQIDTPWTYRNPYSEDPAELSAVIASQLEREIRFQGPGTVAAFIAEPVQGAGGVIVPPDCFWGRVREICDRYGVLLISDEVVTGFGRTGAMFGARGWGVKPDIMCLAKGISAGYVPLGATTINARVLSAWDGEVSPGGMVMHGYTYSGHPLACAAALAVLDIVEREDLPGNAGRMGARLIEALRPAAEWSSVVGEVRGKGLMVGLDLVADKQTRAPLDPATGIGERISALARQEGAIVRAAGPTIILSPPLTISAEEVDMLASTLMSALRRLEDTL